MSDIDRLIEFILATWAAIGILTPDGDEEIPGIVERSRAADRLYESLDNVPTVLKRQAQRLRF